MRSKLNTRKRQTIVVTVLMLALLSWTFAAFAQDDSSLDIEIVGLVESINGDIIQVNGQFIDTSQAEINVELVVDTAVQIEAELTEDGEIIASEVNETGDGLQPNEIQLIGVLQTLGTDTIVVNGLTLSTAGATIDPTMMEGDTVIVYFTINDDDVWELRTVVAREPMDDDDSDDDSDEQEFKGTLEEIGEDYIVVSGQTFSLDEEAIDGTLVLGAIVEVKAIQVDGQWVAVQIKLDDQTTVDDGDDDDDDDDNDNGNDNDDDDDDDDNVNANDNDDDDDDNVNTNTNTNDNDDDDDDDDNINANTNANDNDDDDDDDDNVNVNTNDNDDDDDDNVNINSNDNDDDDDNSGSNSGSDDDDDDDRSGSNSGSDDDDD